MPKQSGLIKTYSSPNGFTLILKIPNPDAPPPFIDGPQFFPVPEWVKEAVIGNVGQQATVTTDPETGAITAVHVG